MISTIVTIITKYRSDFVHMNLHSTIHARKLAIIPKNYTRLMKESRWYVQKHLALTDTVMIC